MKVIFNTISFKSENINLHREKEIYDENNKLIRLIKYDEFGRDTDSFEYNANREIIGYQHKEYTDNGCIETYKNQFQQYRRITKTELKDSNTHYIEEFISVTSPEKNYINEFVRDIAGKLIKVINNGKVVNLK